MSDVIRCKEYNVSASPTDRAFYNAASTHENEKNEIIPDGNTSHQEQGNRKEFNE